MRAGRGWPRPVAGRSLRHPAFAHSMLTALTRSPPLRHPACAGQQRRLSGRGQPRPPGLHGRMPCEAPATCGRQEKIARCDVFREYSNAGSRGAASPALPSKPDARARETAMPGPWSGAARIPLLALRAWMRKVSIHRSRRRSFTCHRAQWRGPRGRRPACRPLSALAPFVTRPAARHVRTRRRECGRVPAAHD